MVSPDVRLPGVRWERLFADLEAQLDAAEAAELGSEVADRARRELALVEFADRLRACVGLAVSVGLPPRVGLAGQLLRVGPDWLLLAVDTQRDAVVPLDAVMWVTGLPVQRAGDAGAVEAKLGLGHVLRGLARDRSPVHAWLRDGERFTGTVDRVGADFADIAEHPIDVPRRQAEVRAVRTVRMSALSAVLSV